MSTQTIFNTFWHISEFNQPRDKAVMALDANGLGGMVNNLSRRASVDRAVKSLHDRRHSTGRRISEKVTENEALIIWGILEKEAGDEVDTVKYGQKTSVMLRKDTGEVTATGSLASEVMDAVHLYDNVFTDDDVRMVLRKVIRQAKGLSLRPTGGVYQLLSGGIPVLEAAKKALLDMGAPAKIYIQQIVSDAGSKEIVTASLTDEIETRLDTILNRVGSIQRSQKAMNSQSEEVIEVQELLETYQELLSDADAYNTLLEKINAAANVVSEAMLKMGDLSSGRSLTVGEIAVKILKEAKKPMQAKDLYQAAVSQGLVKGGTTEEEIASSKSSFSSGLNAAGKTTAGLKMIGRGLYEVAA